MTTTPEFMVDPHTGQQLRFHRKDPTGRWNPLTEEEDNETLTLYRIGGTVLVVSLYVAGYFFIMGL